MQSTLKPRINRPRIFNCAKINMNSLLASSRQALSPKQDYPLTIKIRIIRGRYWGVSSIQPDDGRCQMDRGEEISSGFVVTCRDSAEFLEVAEEVLNEVTRLESRFVIGALVFAIAPGWDHGGFSRGAKQVDHTLIGIECFVCQQSVSLHPRQQCVGAFQIMGFARGQKEGEWIAQGVNQRVDFGAQPAVAGPDRLVLAVFFWAPALCW